MSPTLHLDEVRQIVVVRIRVIEETTLFHQQPPRMDTRAVAAIPAHRSSASAAQERLDRKTDVLTLFVFAETEDLLPSITMAANFVSLLHRCARDVWSLLE